LHRTRRERDARGLLRFSALSLAQRSVTRYLAALRASAAIFGARSNTR
jgi:hypothetical protein